MVSSVSEFRQLMSGKKVPENDVPLELDTTANFRVNSELKARFEKICKANHSTASQELKKYMTRVVAAGRLL